jgi:asparagine synthase (glutamine-hydrolysing)
MRYPYLDQSLVEFLMQIPVDQLHRPGDRRSLMRRALARSLPGEILARQTKQIERRCYVTTLETHWEILKEILTSPISSRLGYIDQSEFKSALMTARNGQMPEHTMLLLRGLFLELWLRDTVKRGVITIPPVRQKRLSQIEVRADIKGSPVSRDI